MPVRHPRDTELTDAVRCKPRPYGTGTRHGQSNCHRPVMLTGHATSSNEQYRAAHEDPRAGRIGANSVSR